MDRKRISLPNLPQPALKLIWSFAKMRNLFVLIFPCLVFLFCAKQGMPPGGPEDKTAPRVILASPSADSTQVGQDPRIEIVFSERMQKKKTEESIFISPVPEIPWVLSWHKNRLGLKPPQSLKPKTTYVITAGTGAVDLRGNRMKESYSFAFSTGDFIDSCRISGEAKTEEKKEAGIGVWAYLLDDEQQVDLTKDKPTYVTQTDYAGKYRLQNLGHGRYRLFAVKDQNRDLEWDIEDEPIGVTCQDVRVDSLVFSRKDVNFVLAPRDTTPPSLVDCRTLDREKIRLDFDESLKQETISDIKSYLIRSQRPPEKTLEVILAYFQGEDTKRVFLVTQRMVSGEKYELLLSGLQDESGNEISSTSVSCSFSGTDLPDTTNLRILYTWPEDKKRDVALDSQVKILLSEPPEKGSLESNFTLEDENEELIKGEFFWESDVAFIFRPESLLSSRNTYEVKLGHISDLSGNPLSDSLFEMSFTTLDQDTLGSVSGEVKVLSAEKQRNIVVLLYFFHFCLCFL